jgi:hypothetical protein
MPDEFRWKVVDFWLGCSKMLWLQQLSSQVHFPK